MKLVLWEWRKPVEKRYVVGKNYVNSTFSYINFKRHIKVLEGKLRFLRQVGMGKVKYLRSCDNEWIKQV